MHKFGAAPNDGPKQPARSFRARPNVPSMVVEFNYSGALGSTNTAVNPANRLKPGMGASGDTFGVLRLASTGSVFDSRQVVLNLRLRF